MGLAYMGAYPQRELTYSPKELQPECREIRSQRSQCHYQADSLLDGGLFQPQSTTSQIGASATNPGRDTQEVV